MKQIIFSVAAFFALQILPAQDVTYVLFNRECMHQLEYRYSYSNLKGDNAVWAYSVRPGVLEHYIFMTEGEGHYSPELPDGTVSCKNLNLDDAFVAGINRDAFQMLIVFQRQSGGYWLMPVASATFVARKGSRYWVRSQQSSFQFDTLRLVNEQNLAIAGSPTAAYFSGQKLNNCLTEYSFHCEPPKAGQVRSDLQFIPSVGIVNDRTGSSASQAMENELQLVKINGKLLEDYITEACPEGSRQIAISKSQKPATYNQDKYESDKELASIQQNKQDGQTPARYSTDADGFACAEAWEPGTHIVQKGENLRAIARTYKVTEQELIKWNKIQNPDRIEICQKIWLKADQNKPKVEARQEPASNTKLSMAENGKTVKAQGITQKAQDAQRLNPDRPVAYSEEDLDNQDDVFAKSRKNAPPRIHTVRRGEYLYKIAKMYVCPEACIRIANTMPLEGDERLTIGQELIIPECTCTVDGKVIKKSAAPPVEAAKPVVKKQAPIVEKQGPGTPKKPRVSILDESDSPVQYSNDSQLTEPEVPAKSKTPLYEDDATPVSDKKPISGTVKKKETPKVPLFKEHLVKQGETLNSIAAKYRVDAFELSQVNGLDPKEKLIPGKLILVPMEEQ
jgi:LysM repeat protein